MSTASGCTPVGAGVTDGRVTASAGSYALTGCEGLGNPNYDVSYTGSLTVLAEDATVALGGERYFSTGSGPAVDVPVSAVVTQADDGAPGDVSAATVDFLLVDPSGAAGSPVAVATGVPFDGSGRASATLPAVPAGTYQLVLRLSPDNGFFAGPGSTERLVVYRPTAGAALRGGGWVRDAGAADGKGHVEVSVRYTKDRVPEGSVSYSWLDPDDGLRYSVRSGSWTGGTFALDGQEAAIGVAARLTVTDPATGAVVPALTGPGHRLRMVALDGGGGGRSDRLAVTVLDPSGSVLHTVARSPLGGGNLTLRR